MSGIEKPPINEIFAVISGIQTFRIMDDEAGGEVVAVFNTFDEKMFVKLQEHDLRSAPLDPVVQNKIAQTLLDRIARHYLPLLVAYPDGTLGKSGFTAHEAMDHINDLMMREMRGVPALLSHSKSRWIKNISRTCSLRTEGKEKSWPPLRAAQQAAFWKRISAHH